MELTEITNRFNGSSITEKFGAVKDHIKEYFLMGDTEDGLVDLKLDIIGEETLSADCDVTDHYVESNIAYQDQISLKPKIYTISGEIGELVWYQKDSASQMLGQVAQRLEGVISFLPVSSRSFTQFKTKAMKALQWVDTASNALSKVSNLFSDSFTDSEGNEKSRSVSNQEQAYEYLVMFRDYRQLLTVKTPWGILQNYVITNMQFTQPKETKDKSYISITLKEFRETSLGDPVKFDMNKYQGNAAFENQPKIDNGKTSGEDASLPTETVTDDNGEEYAQCRVIVNDEVYGVEYSDKYGFSVQDMVKETYLSHDSVEYKDAVAKATQECDEIIGALK